jgi:CheY-like chemotaxis protein
MNIFLSYQRADALHITHALHYALANAGHDAFVDTGSIARGSIFPQEIANAMARTNLMLAIVGRQFQVGRLHEPTNVIAFEWRRARFHGVPVIPVLLDGAVIPPDADWPAELRWFPKRNAAWLRDASLKPDIDALVAAVPTLAAAPRQALRVLWVDDRPSNNEYERRCLRLHGLVFDNVVSTSEALDQLANDSYDLVITDLGRASSDASPRAGEALIEHPAVRNGGPPVVVYAGASAVRRRDELVERGAAAVMADREELFQCVLLLLGRSKEEQE